MAKVVCDKCGKGYLLETGKIKKMYDLDVCYVCGVYEPIEIAEEVPLETSCGGFVNIEGV